MGGVDMNTAAPIGHNSGAVFSADNLEEVAKEAIDAALAKLEPRLAQLLDSETRAAVTDREAAGKVTDLIAMFSSLESRIDAAHQDAKRPYLEAGRVVDGRAAAMRERSSAARVRLNTALTKWQQDEAARIAAIREAERVQEAADPEPSMQDHAAVDRARVATRGDYGSSAKLSDVLVIDKVEVKKLPKAFLERPKILAIIEAEAKIVIRGGGKVTGVTSSTTTASRVRKGG